MQKVLGALTLFVLAVTSCTTSYEPRRSPRIAQVMELGNQVLVKDGKHYPIGLLNNGALEAVAPHAVAMEHAETFQNRLLGGLIIGLVSVVPIGVGTGMAANGATSRNSDPSLGLALVGTGLVAYAIGIGMMMSAPTHLNDAVNVYNDWVDQGMPADATAAF